jgi:hypothetical protein
MEFAHMPRMYIRSPLAHLDDDHSLAYVQQLFGQLNMVYNPLRIDLDLDLDYSRILFLALGCIDQYSTHADCGH